MSERPWLKRLRELKTAAAHRAALVEQYPALASPQLERLVIVGAAPEGRRLGELCVRQGIEVVAVADDNPQLQGTPVGAAAVRPIDQLRGVDLGVPVVVASHRPLTVMERVRDIGFRDVALFMALELIDPDRFPPHMFYARLLEDLVESVDKYEQLSELLADDASRAHLDAVLGFRQTADPRLLIPLAAPNAYVSDLFALATDEVYVDGGAFDGDTMRFFMRRVGDRFAKAWAFEPDPATFARLVANFRGDARVNPVNKGLWSRGTTLRFVADASRGALLDEKGDIVVPVTSIDETAAGERVTLIKMNIEGAELEALNGARGTITAWRPRLAIAGYHRPSDLWRVPFLIHELDPAYELYLRQHEIGIIETVVYGLAS